MKIQGQVNATAVAAALAVAAPERLAPDAGAPGGREYRPAGGTPVDYAGLRDAKLHSYFTTPLGAEIALPDFHTISHASFSFHAQRN